MTSKDIIVSTGFPKSMPLDVKSVESRILFVPWVKFSNVRNLCSVDMFANIYDGFRSVFVTIAVFIDYIDYLSQ